MSRSLHQKITCQKQVLIASLAGEYQKTLADIATVWADVTIKSGDMKTSQRQSYMAQTYQVVTRYQEVLLATRNIIWQQKQYRVVSMINPDDHLKMLEIHMVEDHP